MAFRISAVTSFLVTGSNAHCDRTEGPFHRYAAHGEEAKLVGDGSYDLED